MSNYKVPSEAVERVASSIFNKARFSGGEAARRLGVNQNTLWSWFSSRGVPVEEALALSDIMVEWSVEILTLSQELRAAANEQIREARQHFDLATAVPPLLSRAGAEQPPKGKPGRPLGSKNKPKDDAALEAGEPKELVEELPDTVPGPEPADLPADV